MSVQDEIERLKSQIREIKSAHPIVASNLKFYITKSQEFTATSDRVVRVKFTPEFAAESKSVTRLDLEFPGENYWLVTSVNEPQEQPGEVIIRIAFQPGAAQTTYRFNVVASGTSPGVFTML